MVTFKIPEQTNALSSYDLKKISEKGVSILLVEQKLTIAFNLSKRLFIMGHGKVVYEGTPVDINNNQFGDNQ